MIGFVVFFLMTKNIIGATWWSFNLFHLEEHY